MKMLLILVNLAVLVLLISSCGDILNPEPDSHTTKIKYHSVLKDQEHSVIMPLKVGNIWVYKVTELNEDGSVKAITYDTTLVRKDTLINNEQWFLVSDPSQSESLYYFTNTNAGLFIDYAKCSSCKILRAEYPLTYTRYLQNEAEVPTTLRFYDDYGTLIDQKLVFVTVYGWIDVNKLSDYSIFSRSSDCYKYTLWGDTRFDGKKTNIPQEYISVEYFVPDLGLVRKENWYIYPTPTKIMTRLRELIYTNVKI